jgi:hypothetical protein
MHLSETKVRSRLLQIASFRFKVERKHLITVSCLRRIVCPVSLLLLRRYLQMSNVNAETSWYLHAAREGQVKASRRRCDTPSWSAKGLHVQLGREQMIPCPWRRDFSLSAEPVALSVGCRLIRLLVNQRHLTLPDLPTSHNEQNESDTNQITT